jgi:hypothetical protein
VPAEADTPLSKAVSQMGTPTPSHQSPRPPPLPQCVTRDGDRLIVLRGADISGMCFCCGAPLVARITCHLRTRKGDVFGKGVYFTSSILLILDLLQLILFFLMVLSDIPRARKRTLTYGMCARHLRKRRLMLIAAPITFAIGIALWVYEFRNLNAPVYIGLPAAILGTACLAGGVMFYLFAPGPALAAENEGHLWIKGCAQSLLDRYT